MTQKNLLMKKILQALNFVCILFAALLINNKGIAQPNTSAAITLSAATIQPAGGGSSYMANGCGPITLNAGDIITIPFTCGTTTANNIPVGCLSLDLQWNPALSFQSAIYLGNRDYLFYWNTVTSSSNSMGLVNNQGIGSPINVTLTFKVTTATTIDPSTSNLLYANIKGLTNTGGQSINPPTGANAKAGSPCTVNVLPLKLISFSLQKYKNNEVVLNWSATNQVNTSSFEIERSNNGKDDWQAIGNMPAAGTFAANMNYSYTDLTPKNGSNYYRLKMIDIDGASTYSTVQSVTLTGQAEKIVVWPNVTRDKIYVQGVSTEVAVCVFDMTGQLVLKSKLTNPSEGLSLINLQPKIYIVQIIKDGQLVTSTKVIKQ
jgi:hypothetical protein